MYKKLSSLSAIIVVSFHLLQQEVRTEIIDSNPAIPNISVCAAALTAAGLYVGYNYLIRQDFLVEDLYPAAYAWYNAMATKYPAANLATKIFLQTPVNSLIPDTLANMIKSCNWVSHESVIYFSRSDLDTINILYQKVLDGYPLHDTEKMALARYEFSLLHEAGLIEQQDLRTLMIGLVGGSAAVCTGGCLVDYMMSKKITPMVEQQQEAISVGEQKQEETPVKFVECDLPELKNFVGADAAKVIPTLLQSLGLPAAIPTILATMQGAALTAILVALVRLQRARADYFACDLAESDILRDAQSMFNNDVTDVLYELENKKMKPYVPAQHALATTIQSVVEPFEYAALYAAQQFLLLFKTNALTRYIFDFTQNATNQGPSVRAAMMQKEIDRRQDQ